MNRVLVINGPNLNLLGARQPEIYGKTTLVQLNQMCREWGSEFGLGVETYQSNHEGALIDRLHADRDAAVGVVINAGALTHYSYALHDALDALPAPAVEVHISNIKQREPWRATSVISPACVSTIYGRGIGGYYWALRHLAYRASWHPQTLAYGSGPDRVADLRVPQGDGPHPVAVVIHGGFWRDAWKRDLMDGISVALARAGIATWNIEYRRVGSDGGWPNTRDDVALAIDHLGTLADEHRLDLSRVVFVGHSAGGQLALSAAARASGVAAGGVVAIAPVADLASAHRDGLGADAVEGFLADAAASVDNVLPLASPLHMLPLGVPQRIVHGASDDQVPPEMSDRYVQAARAAGDDVQLIALDGIDHFAPINPRSPSWEAVASAIIGLL